jgi:uncharacterized protein Smg (DUF494 family)
LKEEFLDIVALIVRQMSDPDQGPARGGSILEGLMHEGYEPVEIDDALSWFESLAGSGEELGGREFWDGFTGIRVQSPDERSVISPDAFEYLEKLKAAGVIEPALAETVLDKVCKLGISGFGIEELKALLGLVLFSRDYMESDEMMFLLDASVRDEAVDH